MTPLEIEILMHYHTRADDYRNGDWTAPAVHRAMTNFVSMGVLVTALERRRYDPSEAVGMYMKAICAVPLPERIWVMPKALVEASDGSQATQ